MRCNNNVPGQISDLIDIDAEVAEFQPEIPGEIPVLPDHLPQLPVHAAGDAVTVRSRTSVLNVSGFGVDGIGRSCMMMMMM